MNHISVINPINPTNLQSPVSKRINTKNSLVAIHLKMCRHTFLTTHYHWLCVCLIDTHYILRLTSPPMHSNYVWQERKIYLLDFFIFLSYMPKFERIFLLVSSRVSVYIFFRSLTRQKNPRRDFSTIEYTECCLSLKSVLSLSKKRFLNSNESCY